MEMDSFHLTLPSNVRSSKRNTLATYETILPHTLMLDGEWKVGLSEIQFTNSWFNITNKSSRVSLYVPHLTRLYQNESNYVEPGRYEDITTLVDAVMRKSNLCDCKTMPKVLYKRSNRTVEIHDGVSEGGYPIEVIVSGEAAELMGFDDKSMAPDEYRTGVAKRSVVPYDLSAGIYSVYVYCDVADYSIVGDKCVQLLRSVKIPPKSAFGESVYVCYDSPHYIPISKRVISRIEISLKDDAGKDIPFKFGRTEITLHFVRYG